MCDDNFLRISGKTYQMLEHAENRLLSFLRAYSLTREPRRPDTKIASYYAYMMDVRSCSGMRGSSFGSSRSDPEIQCGQLDILHQVRIQHTPDSLSAFFSYTLVKLLQFYELRVSPILQWRRTSSLTHLQSRPVQRPAPGCIRVA